MPVYQTTAWPARPPKSASSTIFRLPQRKKDSVIGALEAFPSALIRLKMGDSWSWSRMYTEMARSTADRRNGTRQPQVSKLAPVALRVRRMTNSDMNTPTVAVVWIQLVK